MRIKTVMDHNQNDGLLKMIRRTDPMIFILYLYGQPHSHSNNADYIYGRQWNVMKRFGYDYLESPTGTIFR